MNTYQPTPDKEIAKGIFSTKINGLLYIQHSTFKDDRGFFSELGRLPELDGLIEKPYVARQVSHARSNKNVVRGIHAEDWTKYVAVVSGKAFSAIADVRPESVTFGEVECFLFGHSDDALDGSLYIPARLGNSVCVLEEPVNYVYLFDKMYKERDPSGDVAISLFDPDLNIEWPIPKEDMVISERDRNSVTLRERFPEKFK